MKSAVVANDRRRHPQALCEGCNQRRKEVQPLANPNIAASVLQYTSITGIHDHTPHRCPLMRAAALPSTRTITGDSNTMRLRLLIGLMRHFGCTRTRFGRGTRRTAASTACTILDRADGATDVPELANRNLEEVAHVSHSEPDDMSLDNSSAPRRNRLDITLASHSSRAPSLGENG